MKRFFSLPSCCFTLLFTGMTCLVWLHLAHSEGGTPMAMDNPMFMLVFGWSLILGGCIAGLIFLLRPAEG
ncbi:hypothetical protein [Bowmanella dokdonensis]|uniref:Uncharacterized protein n=1 Tax=Bowmanella dokdonensis TaxID=751969 RepID=A0A939DMT8_9ALTE|nr:hypothetical protein [Bowmanella dokdonensis]MBN7825474.1 hypothetical protein [Bowmanella dokdonensis]